MTNKKNKDKGKNICFISLEFAAAFHGSGHGDFVGVFDVTACGDAGGYSGDLQGLAGVGAIVQGGGEPACGGFAFEGRAGGEDNFVDFAAFCAGDQIRGPELVGAYAVERRERAVQDVVDALVASGAFDAGDAGGFLDDAHQALVADGAAAVGAGIYVGYVVADGAEAQGGFEGAHGVGEGGGVFVGRAQDVEGEALRTLGADAGEFFEFVDEPGHGLGVTGHVFRV